MAQSKLQKAIGAVKDQTSIGIAKFRRATLADLDVAIVKATRHEECPAEERHVREILSFTHFSRSYITCCVSAISRRLRRTRNWAVALKALMLVHRLITDGNPAYEQEVYFATRRGTPLLNMSDFRDKSRPDPWDYSTFVRNYAAYLDEHLEFRMQLRKEDRGEGRREAPRLELRRRNEHVEWRTKERKGRLSGGREEELEGKQQSPAKATTVWEMSNERLFVRTQNLIQLLDRFLECMPRGSTKQCRLVLVALYPVVKESFTVYYDIMEILSTLVDRFMGLEVQDSLNVLEIFCRIARLFDELHSFYSWCTHAGIARDSEYPEVEKIPESKLNLMDEYIRKKSYLKAKMEQKNEAEKEEKKWVVIEEDKDLIRSLPPPEGSLEEPKEEKALEVKKQEDGGPKIADLLNLGEEATTYEDQGNKLALALFDGGPAETGTPAPWEAFKDTENWETALVQSASRLSNQQPSLAGGLDMMMLNGMYHQGTTTRVAASTGYMTAGSASSVAFGSTGWPGMLALPATSATSGAVSASSGFDPFSGSLLVPPPSYVQMAEIANKQRLLAEEQLMWQQYARDGMRGQVGLSNIQSNPYP